MTVFSPGDTHELRQVVEETFRTDGPVYLRLENPEAEDIYAPSDRFMRGKATLLREGSDATIITTGTMMALGVHAADTLAAEHGIRARVMQMASLKPLDDGAVRQAAEETGSIVTVEGHNIYGGLGGAVSEVVAELGTGKVKRLAINDHYSEEVGSAGFLMEQEGLTEENLVRQVREMLS